MTGLFRPAFDKFQAEAKIIGTLLTGYTDLEISLLNCVIVGRGGPTDFDSTLKAMYRVRGETMRVQIADGLGRHHYRLLNLEPQFSRAVGMMRHCVKIRNQYAHCAFWDDGTGKLAFANLEEVAKLDEHVKDLQSLTAFHADESLLLNQETYFYRTAALLRWVNYEARRRAGRLTTPSEPEPGQIEAPPLRIQ